LITQKSLSGELYTNLLARSQTWSNYKSHNTVKYLIGKTPQGTISFVSEAWGDRVSSKAITKESSILSHLLAGDVVLADRGFRDLVAEYHAEAMFPPFTKGKSQLRTRENLQEFVSMHVERLIGMNVKCSNVMIYSPLGISGEPYYSCW